MKPVKVSVTKNDIEAGIRKSVHFCPVALAIKRTNKFLEVMVSEQNIRCLPKVGRPLIKKTPKKVKKFITRFDYFGNLLPRCAFKPFKFTIKRGA